MYRAPLYIGLMLATKQGTEKEADPRKADSGLCNGMNTMMSKRDELGKVGKGLSGRGNSVYKGPGTGIGAALRLAWLEGSELGKSGGDEVEGGGHMRPHEPERTVDFVLSDGELIEGFEPVGGEV